MFKGQLLVYRFNNLINAKPEMKRNIFHIEDINVPTKNDFQECIINALDSVPPGKGYVLVRWNSQTFICEKDVTNPKIPYIRHKILYHPLESQFTC